MEPSLTFEGSADVFDQLIAVTQSLENVQKHITKLTEKFEEFLKMITSLPIFQSGVNLPHVSAGGKNSSSAVNNNIMSNTLEQPTAGGLSDIAGMKEIKNILYTLIILPRHQPQLFRNRKISNSILLYGPPGTGKTRLVHGMAAEAGAALHSISMGNLLSSYVGETEKNIKNIFNYLRTCETYSILFIDEIDGLCRKRTSSEHEYSRRIKTELMCQMTKMEGHQNSIIIAATNCPWDLDSAILRRFQKRIYVPLPDNQERMELFQLFTKNILIIQTPEEFAELIQICDGYSGSDIVSLVNDALDIPLTELQSTVIWSKTNDGFYEPYTEHNNTTINIDNICVTELKNLPSFSVRSRPVTVMDFFEAAKNVQVTVTSEQLKQYEMFRQVK